ncbi:MAG: M23 family metallopeptidase, partial [Bacillota bacterium]|nr:M23 family metallopeptidase [Bacillota bacterium]
PLRADRLRAGMELHIPRGEETSVIPGSRAALPALASLSHRGERLFYPVAGSISSRFGPRRSSFHYGLDLAAEAGLSVQAAAGGLVTEAGWKNDAYGYTVMIDHGEGMETLYAHCSRLLVEEGQQVRAGEGIALVGSTGNSTGPHVHFEVRIQGECQDPLDYL